MTWNDPHERHSSPFLLYGFPFPWRFHVLLFFLPYDGPFYSSLNAMTVLGAWSLGIKLLLNTYHCLIGAECIAHGACGI
ncbi:hypothetical protein FB567DRAFT_205135 [Paraphoma chrysanthemicola]|uniref:Uncharacterized protein n=1 Tax=Paraphoma chrysanthemicola TaxID=798071 RepID=A0A8K0QWD5_9PLEO|nr:hypothetical protein FB567DRAFT_205135 [Paraphoma chrysanthemicola]